MKFKFLKDDMIVHCEDSHKVLKNLMVELFIPNGQEHSDSCKLSTPVKVTHVSGGYIVDSFATLYMNKECTPCHDIITRRVSPSVFIEMYFSTNDNNIILNAKLAF